MGCGTMRASSPTRAVGMSGLNGKPDDVGVTALMDTKKQGALTVALLAQDPFHWVAINVFPFFVVVRLISDYMVIIGSLKN